MRERHVIYRRRGVQRPRWQARILTADTPADTTGEGPVGVSAATLADARAVAQARLRGQRCVEHVEHELDRDLCLRQALDSETVRRDHVARLLAACLTDRRVRSWLARTLTAHAGSKAVAVACVPGEPVAWIVDQYDTTPLVVATAVCNSRAWWSLLAEPAAAAPGQVHASLAGLGLLDPHATLEDWMVRVPLGRVLTLAASGTTGGEAPLHPAA